MVSLSNHDLLTTDRIVDHQQGGWPGGFYAHRHRYRASELLVDCRDEVEVDRRVRVRPDDEVVAEAVGLVPVIGADTFL